MAYLIFELWLFYDQKQNIDILLWFGKKRLDNLFFTERYVERRSTVKNATVAQLDNLCKYTRIEAYYMML